MRRRVDIDLVVLGICALFMVTLACSMGGSNEPTEIPPPENPRPTTVVPTDVPPPTAAPDEPVSAPTSQPAQQQPTSGPNPPPTTAPNPQPTQAIVATSFGPLEDWTKGQYYGEEITLFADVTGDGLADAIAVDYASIYVRRSNGSEFLLPYEIGPKGPFTEYTGQCSRM